MKKAKILVCGGDRRNLHMAELFSHRGFEVAVSATDAYLAKASGFDLAEPSEGAREAEIVVLGLPAVKSDMTVNGPLSGVDLKFEELLETVGENTFLAGGRFSPSARIMISDYGFKAADYSVDEVFQIENAFYTAEGAVAAIIENTARSLGELEILVTGYGRIAKALTKMLSCFGPRVTVYARKSEQRAWAKAGGLGTEAALSSLERFDVIVNTVPASLFDKAMLAAVKKDALIVDLSARPGYVGKSLCEKNNIKLVYLPGMPALCAPRSAGEAAARAVMRMYDELTEGDGA